MTSMKNDLIVDEHGNKRYYLNDKRHRENGPAVKLANGYVECWIDGKCLNQEEYKSLTF